MELTNSFTVPLDVAAAWEILLDIEQVAQCLPGATLDTVDHDNFTGRVRVKLGPVQLTYRGSAEFVERDDTTHRAVIKATGKETKGSGTASATITTSLEREGDQTRVNVVTVLTVTGKPAQFGRGVMQDVSNQLLGQFADCLAGQLSAAHTTAASEPSSSASNAMGHGAATREQHTEQRPVDVKPGGGKHGEDAINLVGIAGWPIVKRLAVPLVLLVAIVVVVVIAI
ncbi:SRPBCC family protein [Haloechinothrix salitolerans]|uniref:SRPBCC family protein n=1 Tax=Haloechinothrix salitolerans TaxID=926830 RepID=A0ABW2BVH0_9PSEU